ncbi:peptidase family protein [Desulfitobacterium dichloroeliminans LMG P-21439]|uniref:Peptidase family protein n=1 Tax=Desulfitobacterium dichloroeliminans (strain LMG P-21439 / DCA1) TaxID=871963 RepID=L0F9J7_DESDL|nr:M42 family metallopeptidase [Desulfitobacterium dichloroeliminans]AGA69341.1 peptidase family protein [Desulfitobacterium dichloroeliminans LMG P-21439]
MLLKALTQLNGTSGAEQEIRTTLTEELRPFVSSIQTDKIGNLIVQKNSLSTGPKVMIAAHMDEVALMITAITSEGFLKFKPVGGIDSRILVSKPVQINSLLGVIGAKAIHLQKPKEREQALKIEQLYIDIGATAKEEAEKHVKIGDYAYFYTETESLGEGYWKGKAFDDRVGCTLLAELLKKDYPLNLIGAFTVQEEVELRGSAIAAFHVQPDLAIILEGTISAHMMEVEEGAWVTEPGKGPALSIMDSATLYQPKLLQQVTELADKNGIPYQFRKGHNGGNDAGSIHLSREGIPTIAISVPCRYIHSTASVMAEADLQNALKLVDIILKSIPNEFKF